MANTATRTATQSNIEEQVRATLNRLEAKDPGLKHLLKKAYGYAVFPNVGKAALVVGGSYGRGGVFERGRFIGNSTITQFTVGLQLGGDTFTEVVVFENKQALNRFKQGKLAFAANASAVLVQAAAAGTADFQKGVMARAYAKGGMLLEAAIGGQKFNFKPAAAEGKQGQGASEEEESDEATGEAQFDDSGDQEGEEQGNLMSRAGALVRRVPGGVKTAASATTGMVKRHPVAATLVGVGVLAGVGLIAARAIRGFGGDEAAEDQQDEDEGKFEEQSEAQMSGGGAEEQQEREDEGAGREQDEASGGENGIGRGFFSRGGRLRR